MRDMYDITDDLFTVFEQMRVLFRRWTQESPDAFMDGMLKLQALERELEQALGDEKSVHLIIHGIYVSVFPLGIQTHTPLGK